MTDLSNQNEENQLVVFQLGGEEYGISILYVQEIKLLSEITRVPYAPFFVKGVVNLRGSVLPVIDLKKRLSLAEEAYSEESRIMILKIDDISFGMLVDSVREVLAVNEEQIRTTESVVDNNNNKFIRCIANIDERLIIMLNLDEIIKLTGEA